MNSTFPSLGILGAGQLALMLRDSAFRLGISPWIMAASPDAPAARFYSKVVLGSETDPIPLQDFLSRCEVVIFENEFVDASALRRGASSSSPQFFPSLDSIELLQEKLGQKNTLRTLKIPTAPWVERTQSANAREWFSLAHASLQSDLVLKWSKHGYDGKGVLVLPARAILKPEAHLELLETAAAFCKKADERGVRVYAESRVDFRRELAIAVCAPERGKPSAYPLVVSTQVDGICDTVAGPARSLGIAPRFESAARTYAQKLAKKTGLTGMFALELFETRDGKLLVNEIAPRVHNSAHYTQDASHTSQFENQIRAALGLPLGSTESAPAFGMVNLLGALGPPPAGLEPEMHFHWYGKTEARPGRKLGHINAVGSKPSEVGKLIHALQKTRAKWYRSLQ